jgi:hypothetical protein
VRPTCAAEAPNQYLIGCVQKQYRNSFWPRSLDSVYDPRRHFKEGANSHVYSKGYALCAVTGQSIESRLDYWYRKIVDAKKTQILQRCHGGGLASPAQAGDDYHHLGCHLSFSRIGADEFTAGGAELS